MRVYLLSINKINKSELIRSEKIYLYGFIWIYMNNIMYKNIQIILGNYSWKLLFEIILFTKLY
jgi:hypothetical protein